MPLVRQLSWLACGILAQAVAWIRHAFVVGYEPPMMTGVIHLIASGLFGVWWISLMLYYAPDHVRSLFDSKKGLFGAIGGAIAFFGKASLFGVLPVLTLLDLALGRNQPKVGVFIFVFFLPAIAFGLINLVARLASND